MTEKRFQKRYIEKYNKVYDTWKEMPITDELNFDSLLNVLSHLNGLGEMIDTKIEQGRYCVRECKELEKENEHLKEALKNSYMNEICENCKYGNYCLLDNYYGGFEGDFECLKKHFGNDHWKCDGLTECDEFELEIKGDVE